MSEVPGPGAYNVLPASGNMLRPATDDAGQAEKRGRKMVGIWMKILGQSTIFYSFALFICSLCCSST